MFIRKKGMHTQYSPQYEVGVEKTWTKHGYGEV